MPVDALTPTWINAPDDVSGPAYDAETLRRDFAGLVSGGSSAGVARSGVLDPRALAASLSGSSVQVSPGPCVVGSGKGAYFSGAAATVTVATLGSTEWPSADSTNPRRDRLVFEILDPDNGGSTARKARFRVIAGQPSATALSGGGYPADPGTADGVSAFFNIADIDVPKNGGGNPVVTDRRPFTAAAGGVIPVRDGNDLATVTKVLGRRVQRQDLAGVPAFTWDGSRWAAPPLGFIAQTSNSGATATGTGQNALVTNTVTLQPNRRIKVTAKVTAKPDTVGLYAEYQIFAGGVGLDTFAKRFSDVNLGESLEFTAAWGSGSGGSQEFSLQCRVVSPSGTSGLVKSDAFAVKLSVSDDGIG